MKAKKIIALAMSVAMAVGTASFLAACDQNKDPDPNPNPGPGTEYVEDTRIWFAVGRDSKGTLKDQGWDNNNAKYAFARDTSVTTENVFTLSLDIYAGNIASGLSFKFLYKTSAEETDVPWARQVGIHAFEGMDGYEGEDLDSVIKIDGETVFTTASDNGDNGSNMQLEKGQEGTYKFTLKTMSDTDTPKLSVERTKRIEVTHDMYLRGDRNNFSAQNMVAMTENVGSDTVHTTWSTQLSVTANDLWRDADGNEVPADANDPTKPGGTGTHTAIQVYNARGEKVYVTGADSEYKSVEHAKFNGKGDYSIILLPEGSYTIVYDQVDNSVVITAGTHKMYFRGSVEGMGWSTALTADDDQWMLTESEDGSYWSAYLTNSAEVAVEVKLYNGLKSGDAGWVGVNNMTLEPGKTYAFKFTLEGEVVEFEEVAYYLVGTFVDENDENVDFGKKGIVEGVHPKFTKEGDLLTATFTATDITSRPGYTWIVDQGKDGVFGVQIVAGSKLLGVKEWGVANSGSNIFVQAGTWTVTVDTANGWTYTVTAAQA